MAVNKHQILCTKLLDDTLTELVQQENIDLDCISFIEIKPVKSVELSDRIQALAQQNIKVIFTSSNAVEAVDSHLISPPSWEVYCIGGKTKDTIKEKFGNITIKGFADTAKALAKLIVKNNTACTIYFFSGNKRLNHLPEILSDNLFDLEEVVVYTTEPAKHIIEKEYDGIIFFSPSAVKSFFEVNKIKDSVVMFAIGDTTATEIGEHTNNRIVISRKPDAALLLQMVVETVNT